MAAHIEQEDYEHLSYNTNKFTSRPTPDLRPYMLGGVEYTDKNLGDGSFGSVEEVIISGTVCACKKLHHALIDPRNQGVDRINSRFESECRLMSCVRHPNVVQFLGLCDHPASRYPALVMERLACSVEDLLTRATKENSIIPFSLKISILTDTLKGLVYLHDHNPCIVHRDLTSKNVLLTRSMEAKIADLGNALIIDPQTMNNTLTRTPGTAVYMPPEAMAYHSKGYNAKVDIFSFGHLALYLIIQEFPEKLLQATYAVTVDDNDRLLARSEIERRQPYIETLYQTIGKEHLLSTVIKRCLNNMPERRLTAKELLKQILDAPECMLRDERDVYQEFSSMHKLELVQLLQNCRATPQPEKDKKTKIDVIHTQPSVVTATAPAPPPIMSIRSNESQNWSLSDHLKNGVPGQLEITTYKKSGSTFSRKTVSKKQYTFQILDGTLLYYEQPKKKGEIKLDDVVDATMKESKSPHIFPFDLVCKGKEHSSLHLGAFSEEERTSWIEAITNKGADVIEEYDIVCAHNEAYQTTRDDHTTKHDYSSIPLAPSAGTLSPQVVSEATKKEEALYDEIDYDKCLPTTKAAGTQNANASVSTLKENAPPYLEVVANSTRQLESHNTSNGTAAYEPEYTPMDSRSTEEAAAVGTNNHSSVATNGKHEMNSLFYMLEEFIHWRTTNSSKATSEFQNELNENSDQYYANDASSKTPTLSETGRSLSETDTQSHQRPPPLPPKPQGTPKQRATNKTHQSHSESSDSFSPERPASLALGRNGTAKLGRSNTYPKLEVEGTAIYVNDIPETSSKGDNEGTPGIPSLVIEQPTDEGIPRERKISSTQGRSGLLDPSALRMALKEKLKTKDHSPQSPLLVTGDSESELLEERPDWAIPSTDVSPLPSPQIFCNPLSLLQQQASNLFLQSTALCGLQEIGKGQFGKVYKATLKRSEHSPGVIVAVKEIKEYKSEQEMSDFQREMSVMKDMMHPNIIHLYGMIKEGTPQLVLEYLPKGDLKNHLTCNKRPVNTLVKYMIDVAMGMHYLADKGLVHRDLAARNIMVDDNETCKVADFGLLREIPKDDTIYHATRQMPWPIRWMAPESLGEREFSSASDVWSFGVLCWEMYHPTKLPYAKFTDNMQCVMKVTKGYRLSIPSAYPSTVNDIMKACWQTKPKNRPSFALILMSLTNIVVQELTECRKGSSV